MPRPAVTCDDYARAIARLASVARDSNAGGEAAARILLSAYDPIEWGFSADDVARLDPEIRDAALTVLQALAELGGPQHFVDADGDDPARLFRELWHLWRGPEQQALDTVRS